MENVLIAFGSGAAVGVFGAFLFLRAKYPQVIAAIEASVLAAEKATVQKAVDAVTKAV